MSLQNRQNGGHVLAEEQQKVGSVVTEANHGSATASSEPRPPLPPRPSANLSLLGNRPRATSRGRPPVRGNATTGLSLTDVNTHVYQDGSRDLYATTAQRAKSRPGHSARASDAGDSTSIKSFRSYAPNNVGVDDMGSFFGGVIGGTSNKAGLFDTAFGDIEEEDNGEESLVESGIDFSEEFTPVGELNSDASNEELLLGRWRTKAKHFIILSAAGKPIYTRHGDPGLISGYVGVIQTIISFYERSNDSLRTFTAGGSRFVILSQNNLFLVAISRLHESEAQLRTQLDALYMQILSTLTLPQLEHIFSIRPSSDLRRPLQGTEVLLSSLADSFTRGSPSTLLSALESLKLRKSHRQAINNVFLKSRTDELLYGLLVAGGRLVSVVRPKKHSLHPSDLQLIFNMIFEAEGVKASGGESWIPICLPGFNSSGYLHMYVNFLSLEEIHSSMGTTTPTRPHDEPLPQHPRSSSASSTPNIRTVEDSNKDTAVAVILISTLASAFPSLQSTSRTLLSTLQSQTLNSCPLLSHITDAISSGLPSATDIIPGNPLHHFLYKSRSHVQFVMPSFPYPKDLQPLPSLTYHPSSTSSDPLSGPISASASGPTLSSAHSQRDLMTIYSNLHASLHAKNAHVKVQHCVNARQGTALAWMTPLFELYAVGGRGTSRAALATGANMVVKWAQKEEERLFLIGGAVF